MDKVYYGILVIPSSHCGADLKPDIQHIRNISTFLRGVHSDIAARVGNSAVVVADQSNECERVSIEHVLNVLQNIYVDTSTINVDQERFSELDRMTLTFELEAHEVASYDIWVFVGCRNFRLRIIEWLGGLVNQELLQSICRSGDGIAILVDRDKARELLLPTPVHH